MLDQKKAIKEEKTFCRICTAHCGLILSLDNKGRPVSVRADKEDPQTMGYICSKGVSSADAHTDESRLLHPLKRTKDGSFEQISRAQAYNEIAARLNQVAEQSGPNSIAGYRGTGGFFHTASWAMMPGFLEAFDSYQLYTTQTIDQSAKFVTAYRTGIWPAGKHSFQTSDVAMMFGGNPFVSMAQLDSRHPIKRLAEAKARGLKLIMIDPRLTETAKQADLFLQPLPGHDAALAAAMLHIILKEGWHDQQFCAEHVGDLEQLRAAVEPFDPQPVAAQAGVKASEIEAITRLFAKDSKRGTAVTGTGVDMGPDSNLAEHLIECLNIVCGRYIRAGEEIGNGGLIMNRGPKQAQVYNLPRPWESGPRTRRGGYGQIYGEMVTGVLADEILEPGENQIRALIVHGGNPANAVPDQNKMVKALRSLDLLVSIEPFMSATARLADYILPPKLQFERADLPMHLFESYLFPRPYTRYAHALATPPAGSELCDESDIFWQLVHRAGRSMSCLDEPIDPQHPPNDDMIISRLIKGSPVDLDLLKQHPGGYFHEEKTFALPADPNTAGKFTTMPDDVMMETRNLTERLLSQPTEQNFPFRLTARRTRHRMNSTGGTLPALTRALPHNKGHMNPEDMARLGITDGDWIEVRSEAGIIRVIATAEKELRTGIISIIHGFGGLPEEEDFNSLGASINLLLTTDDHLQPINAMPRMTAVPVSIHPMV
jgi:anaerobic selenocysteine-containing dehydrogenase